MKDVARGLKRLDLKLDRIVTSPLVRALRTAEIVAETLDLTGALEVSDSLRADRDASTIRDWLRTRNEARLMLVGHNPSLTDLIGLLVSGNSARSPVELRKGGIAALSSIPGSRMQLEWLARPRLFRRLA